MHRDDFKRAIWAVDPFVTEPIRQVHTLTALNAITQGLQTEIEPVSIVGPGHREIPGRPLSSSTLTIAGGPSVRQLFTPESAIKSWIEHLKAKNVLEPKCLGVAEKSLGVSVEKLLWYAKETHTDLIALNTRAREGFPRLLLGSFAESLILRSPISLLIVPPLAEPLNHFREIILPTDLSDDSLSTYRKVLHLAVTSKTKVTLFHKFQFIEADSDNFEEMRLEVEKVERKLDQWKAMGGPLGVECEVVRDEKPGNIAESIVTFAGSRKSALVAMQKKTGPVLSALLGSVTRQVVRHADCPILVLSSQ